MSWWLRVGVGSGPTDEQLERQRILARLADQERRVRDLDRALEVISRRLPRDPDYGDVND